MPLVDLKCNDCGKEKESVVKSTSDTFVCACGGTMKAAVGKSSFTLKGKGWFKDGYSN